MNPPEGMEEIPEDLRDQLRPESHFNHSHHRLRMVIDEVAEDPEVIQRWPYTSHLLSCLAEALSDVIYLMDGAITYEEPAEVIDNVLVGEIEHAVIACAEARKGHSHED